MKKIVFITPGIRTGGAEKQLAILAKGLVAYNFELIIISLSPSDKNTMLPDFDNLRVVQCNFRLGLGLLNSIFKIRSLIRTIKPDIIQGWMYAGNIVASLAGFGLPADIYHCIRASNMDAKRYGKQIWLNGKLSLFTKAVIINSKSGFDYHEKIGFKTKKLRVISNGINCMKFYPDKEAGKIARSSLGLKADDIVCLYVARVDPMKAHNTLVKVAALCPKIRFVFVGNGTEKLDAPKNVTLLGSRSDMRELYNASDLLVNWSHYGEGFPNVIAEAMACGTPVFANNIGDSWFIIGDTGYKSSSNSPHQIANEIKTLVQMPISIAEKKRIIKRIKENFSYKCMIKAYFDIYNNDDAEISL